MSSKLASASARFTGLVVIPPILTPARIGCRRNPARGLAGGDPGSLLGHGHGPVENVHGPVELLLLDHEGRDELEPVVQVAALLEEQSLADAEVEHPAGLVGG